MAPATCIFCQILAPDARLTGEHVIPEWADEVLTSAVVGPDLSVERTVVGPHNTKASAHWEPHKLAGIKVPAVCGPCNYGWMSGYDGTVKHWLSPMMLGYNVTLSVEQQLTVATWATLKAMVLDFGWGRDKPQIFSQEDRDLLFKQRHPPSTVEVRLAALESNGMPVYVRGTCQPG